MVSTTIDNEATDRGRRVASVVKVIEVALYFKRVMCGITLATDNGSIIIFNSKLKYCVSFKIK